MRSRLRRRRRRRRRKSHFSLLSIYGLHPTAYLRRPDQDQAQWRQLQGPPHLLTAQGSHRQGVRLCAAWSFIPAAVRESSSVLFKQVLAPITLKHLNAAFAS